MSNSYRIPEWLEKKVRQRDQLCVYCGIKLREYRHVKGTPSDKATIEHIDNYGGPAEKNIAMCCSSCNSSKGIKKLSDWLLSFYCQKRKITKGTVAKIVRQYLQQG